MIAEVDGDQSGGVDFDEFMRLIKGSKKGKKGVPQRTAQTPPHHGNDASVSEDDKYHKLFRKFDVNNDGTISTQELKESIKKFMKKTVTDEQVTACVALTDDQNIMSVAA